MTRLLSTLAVLSLLSGCAKQQTSYEALKEVPLESMSPDIALDRLKEGNERFLAGVTRWQGVESSKLASHRKGQNPYAMVISCADSRVPVEHIFDAGVGDLFVMRVAGNVASPDNVASAEYAALALKTPLLLVLGHASCGAVDGSLKIDDMENPFPADLQALLEDIRSGVVTNGTEPSLENAIDINVRQQIDSLMQRDAISSAVNSGDLIIQGAVYDIGTGRVEFLSDS